MYTQAYGSFARRLFSRLACLITASLLAHAGLAQTAAPAAPENAKPPAAREVPVTTTVAKASDEVVELSPFVVTADSDVGYVASSSLAGSRLNTPLADTGAAINVLTAEFLQDLAALNFEEALAYAGNVQSDDDYGSAGNLNGGNAAFFSFRRFSVRGLTANLTRNYFPWELSTDNYNIDRIEEQRGPNSILFGIGSAGGIVNANTKRANIGRNFNRFTVVAGSHDTIRGTFDFNRKLTDRLAIRLNGVYSDIGSYKLFAFNRTKRLHLATTFKLTKKTTLYTDAEIGDIKQVNARFTAVGDGFLTWRDAGSTMVGAPVAANATLGLQRFATNVVRLTYLPQTGQLLNMQGRNLSNGTTYDILDESIASYTVNPAGPGSLRFGDFKDATFMLEHQFGEKTFAQLAGNYQQGHTDAYITGQGRTQNQYLYADPNTLLPDGSANPNAGQFLFEGDRYNRNVVDTRARDLRLTVSTEFDLGKWGNYRLAGMGEANWNDREVINYVEAWEGSPFSTTAAEAQANIVVRRNYATPGDWSTYAVAGPGFTGLIKGIQDPTNPARTLNSTWVTFNSGTPQNTPVENYSALIGLQARYFGGKLVLGTGLRRDKEEIVTHISARDPATLQFSLEAPGARVTRQTFFGSTRTLGAVYHLNNTFSVFYNWSNTLGLPSTNFRILPDSQPAPAPEGQGQDYGVAVNLFDRKVVVRASAYKVDTINGVSSNFGSTTNRPLLFAANILDALVANNVITQAEADPHYIADQNGSTSAGQSKGYELSVTGNLTKNWRVSVQYSFTEGKRSSVSPEVREWGQNELDNVFGFKTRTFNGQPVGDSVLVTESGLTPTPTINQYIAQWHTAADLIFRNEGNLSIGTRQHKGAVFTRYSFSSGPLKGLFVGAGHRYQSPMVIANRTDGTTIWGNSFWYTDALLGYNTRKIPFFKKGLNLQLNVTNLWDRTRPLQTSVAGANEALYQARLVEPRAWRLTASFEF